MIFGKDVSNLSLAEAATIAGMIQAPPTYSPFRFPDRARERRNVVLRAMADSGFATGDQVRTAQDEPLTPVARALDAEAPWFVDLIGQQFNEAFPGVTREQAAVDIYARPAPAAHRARRCRKARGG
jgi:membrane peptidoglycan carboxypeptidase